MKAGSGSSLSCAMSADMQLRLKVCCAACCSVPVCSRHTAMAGPDMDSTAIFSFSFLNHTFEIKVYLVICKC